MAADLDSVNFIHRYIGELIAGVAVLVLWLLKNLGARVLDQYVTEKKLYEVLGKHSESVAVERKKELQASEDRLFIRIVEAVKK